MIERLWNFLSITLLALAAIFVWRNNFSAAFVTAALGACAWFLGYRTQLRKTIKDDDESSADGPHEHDHLEN
ncbi:MAG TPA: hypothetical protein VE961_03840 [Pyrinomonadaceae bacterium]|nr:hypothetical protein [Pyrinomonadaceae bacterium]